MHELTLDGGLALAVLQIIAIDIMLGGDNAVVIALACRKLPMNQRSQGIFWGVLGAIALRIVLIFFALHLLELPFLKIVGAVLLLWIGVKLLLPDEEGGAEVHGSETLLGAVRTVVVADAVMSLDNVVAVAGAARGHLGLVAFGIAISIPIIVWGSKLILMLMVRFPIVITLGAGLLGWIAGHMWLGDAALAARIPTLPSWAPLGSGLAGAILVVLAGRLLAARRAEAGTPP